MKEAGGDQHDVYLVDSIVGRRVRRGRVEYRVRWKGFPPDQDSWEPYTSLREPCMPLIQAFHINHRKFQHSKRPFSLPLVSCHGKIPRRALSVRTFSSGMNPRIGDNRSAASEQNILAVKTQPPRAPKRVIEQSTIRPASRKIEAPNSVSLISCNSTLPTTAHINKNTISEHEGTVGATPLLPSVVCPDPTSTVIPENKGFIRSVDVLVASDNGLVPGELSTTSSTASSSPYRNKNRSRSRGLTDAPASKRAKVSLPGSSSPEKPFTYVKETSTSSTTSLNSVSSSNSNPKMARKKTSSNLSRRNTEPICGSQPSAKNASVEKQSGTLPKSSSPDVSLGPSRKSVTIMLKASPTHEFQNTKALQSNRSCSPKAVSSSGAKSLPTKKQAQISGFSEATSRAVSGEQETKPSKVKPEPSTGQDSAVVKVMDIISQLREARKRPVQEQILSMSKRQYDLSEPLVKSALDILVTKGELHRIQFDKGISYRCTPHVVARGDLNKSTSLSAKIRAKYVSVVGKNKNCSSSRTVATPQQNPSKQISSQNLTSFTRHESSHSNSNKFCPVHGKLPKTSSTIPNLSRSHSNVQNTVSLEEGIHLNQSAVIVYDMQMDREATVHLDKQDKELSTNLSATDHSQEVKVYIVPPTSPLNQETIQNQINNLPHRRLNQVPNFSTRSNSNSLGINSNSHLDKLTTIHNYSNNIQNELGLNNLINPKRSLRQNELNYRFRSLCVKRNPHSQFIEVWLQSPSSCLKNTFSIQVLEELTILLNRTIDDSSRLLMISGMGTVFSCGIDLTTITGTLSASSFVGPCDEDCSSTSSESGNSSAYPNRSTNISSKNVQPNQNTSNQHSKLVSNNSNNKLVCTCTNSKSNSNDNRNFNNHNNSNLPSSYHNANFHATNNNNNDNTDLSWYFCKSLNPLHIERLVCALKSFLLALVSYPKPVIVGVNGPAIGLAVSILPLCDLIYVSDSATFYMPYIKLGQIPEAASIYTFNNLIGLPLANELLLAGRKLSAREALQRGLASDLLFPKNFKQELIMRCQKLAQNPSRSLETTKCMMRMQHRERIEFIIKMECQNLLECWQTPEFKNSAMKFILQDLDICTLDERAGFKLPPSTMDWLMGKARGVSRGFMHAPNNVTALTVSESVCVNSNSPCASPGIGNSPPSCISSSPIDLDNRQSPILSKDILLLNESKMEAPLLMTISTSNSVVVNGQTRSILGSSSSCNTKSISKSTKINSENDIDVPLYMKNSCLSQQLPISFDASYPEFSEVVEPFPAMDTNEWLAAHAIALFDNLSTIFDAIYELCDCQSLWDSLRDSNVHSILTPLIFENSVNPGFAHSVVQCDEDRGKKNKNSTVGSTPSSRISARQAIDSALSSCHDLIQSPRIFPVRNGERFPQDLPQYVSTICKNLLVCILHIYVAHFHHLVQFELIPHMNTLARHFFAFCKRFSLVDDKLLESLACFGETTCSSSSNDLPHCAPVS